MLADRIVAQVKLLDIGKEYQFISENNSNRIKLLSIDSDNGPIRLGRVLPTKEVQSVTVSTANLEKMASSIKENIPFSIDAIVGASGNWRSAFESILAYAPEFYHCKLNGQKRLVWCPQNPHALNEQVGIDCAVLPREIEVTSNRDTIIAEFQYFIENCTKSPNSFRNYFSGFSAIAEYIRKFNPTFSSLLDYTNAAYLQSIYDRLMDDPDFVERDSGGKSKTMYSNAFTSYLMFLRARNFFAKKLSGNLPICSCKTLKSSYRPYITAIKSKPFILLAGISGTGKSRIVRQLAYATGGEDSNKIQKPYNYEIIQVRPNWHDSTELLGYETRISGRAEYVVTDFLRFLAKAWYFEEVPFFLCLDEMNLAPVEQYFAEYLSVLETRKLRDGDIVSDTLLPALSKYDEKNEETGGIDNPILNDLFGKEWRINGDVVQRNKAREAKLVEKFRVDGITLPPNLIVMGTVNMDETTFSFSRKVLDRAMTIEMNGVDFSKGLMREDCRIAPIAADVILPDAVEAMDVYEANQAVCDVVIAYLNEINSVLEGTPFKVAYRTRNEFILYVLANLQYTGNDTCYKLIRALDEMTLMKILSRIEGDKNKLMNLGKTGSILDDLTAQIKQSLEKVYQDFDASGSEKSMYVDLGKDSVSLCKLGEMKRKLDNTYYCTFWS